MLHDISGLMAVMLRICYSLKQGGGWQSTCMKPEMKIKPKITIVTISFNQVKFLERTLLSVLEQDYPNIEYIVVDPGSIDGSRIIIERYRDRIAHVVFQTDDGPADSLNKGFDKASGEIYGFLNSGDFLLPGAVSMAMEYLANHPKVGVVSGQCLVMDAQDNVLRKGYSTDEIVNRDNYIVTNLMQPSVFFRKESFEAVNGFNPYNKSSWDSELFVDMKLHGAPLAKMNALWGVFRLNIQSIASMKKLKEIYKIHDETRF